MSHYVLTKRGQGSKIEVSFNIQKVLLKVLMPGVGGSGSQRRESDTVEREGEGKKGQLINTWLSVVNSKSRHWEGWESPNFSPVLLKITTSQSP